MTVGRVAQCEIHIDDQAVSRRHCTLTVRESALVVTDLESANGTFLNERPVKSATARPGDLIRVGSTVSSTVIPTARAAARPRQESWRMPTARCSRSSGSGSSRPISSGCRRRHPRFQRSRCCSARSGISRPCTACPKCWPAPAIFKPWPMPRSKQSSTSPPPIERRLVQRREGTTSGEADVAAVRLRSPGGCVHAEPHHRHRHDYEGRLDVRARRERRRTVRERRQRHRTGHPIGDVRAAPDDRRGSRRALRR